jgi:methionyl-tRNA formyltransferase
MTEPFKIVFMGTPDFAVPALKALHDSSHEVSLVVTQPDRPRGRGRKLLPPPVKQAALDLGYEVFQPVSVRTHDFLETVKTSAPDILVVTAFGHILAQTVLDAAPWGAVNIHGSLLPKYRGPAPVQWALINGETETGVSTMLMDKGMDTGPILLSRKIGIGPDDTSASLHDRLAVLGAELLIETLEALRQGRIHPVPQDHDRATYAPMLKKKDGHINWDQPAEHLNAFVRGMTPWPGAFTFFRETRLKILKIQSLPSEAPAQPGIVMTGGSGELRIATGSGMVSVLEIQGESGKQLPIRDFLRGCPIPPGTVLT